MPKLSVTIITKNEAKHIGAAIDSVRWADEIVVVDCGSTDDTVAIAKAHGARVEHRDWTGWVDQKTFAHGLAANDWILSVDADERVTPELAAEIQALLTSEPPRRGYRMPRVSFILGRWVRTTDHYPDWQLRLYDRREGRWVGEYVHESVKLTSPMGYLKGELHHFSYEDLADQVARLNHYSTLAAQKMYVEGRRTTLVEIAFHPPAAFIRNYFLRRGFMDGAAGYLLSAVSAYGVFIKFAKLWELSRPVGTAIPHDTESGRP
ncbi:MAG: glycosyltransferase family 2 protein [Vicinamibacterales bacterium]